MERATGRSRHARRPWLLVFIRGTRPAVMRDETNDPPGAAALGHAVVIAGFVPPRDQRAGSARALASNDIETPLGFAMRSSSDVARARPSDPSHVTRRSRSRHPRSSSSRIFVRGPRSRSPALARPPAARESAARRVRVRRVARPLGRKETTNMTTESTNDCRCKSCPCETGATAQKRAAECRCGSGCACAPACACGSACKCSASE